GGAGAITVLASTGALVLLDRRAMVEAGGWEATGSVEASVIDLCLRLRSRGGATVCAPDVVAFDHRSVDRPSALTRPLDETKDPWRWILERHGPALRRAAAPPTAGSLDIV